MAAGELPIKVNLGAGFAEQFQEIQGIVSGKTTAQSIHEMKELMQKSVAELVSGDDEDVKTVQIRGRQLVIPRGGTQKAITILFGCLYALENPEADKVLRELDLRALFRVGDELLTEPLVRPQDAPTQVKKKAEASPEEDADAGPTRNILLGPIPPGGAAFPPGTTVEVLVGGKTAAVGIVADAPCAPGAVRVRPLLGGAALEASAGDLRLIATPQDLMAATQRMASGK